MSRRAAEGLVVMQSDDHIWHWPRSWAFAPTDSVRHRGSHVTAARPLGITRRERLLAFHDTRRLGDWHEPRPLL